MSWGSLLSRSLRLCSPPSLSRNTVFMVCMQIMLIVKTLTKEVCSVTVSDLIGNEEKL